jgi:D-alanyl-D-alanine carboxypeptidase
MHRHREAAAYLDALPRRGLDGTLRKVEGHRSGGNIESEDGTLR